MSIYTVFVSSSAVRVYLHISDTSCPSVSSVGLAGCAVQFNDSVVGIRKDVQYAG